MGTPMDDRRFEGPDGVPERQWVLTDHGQPRQERPGLRRVRPDDRCCCRERWRVEGGKCTNCWLPVEVATSSKVRDQEKGGIDVRD